MKVYTLTIVYNQEKEESEYISEEIEGDTAGVLQERGVIDMSDEEFDEEDLEFISGCYIVGEA